MTAAILIIALIIILFFLLRKNSPYNNQTISNENDYSSQEKKIKSDRTYLFDESGKKYYETPGSRKIAKRLYIHGLLNGKYHGELDKAKEEEYLKSRFFNFTIYESQVETIETDDCSCIQENKQFCHGIHTESEDSFKLDVYDIGDNIIEFNKSIPAIVSIKSLDKKFNVSILEPQLKNLKLDTKLHQTENHEVFGTLTCEISGYIIQEETETFTNKVYVDERGIDLPAVLSTLQSSGKSTAFNNFKPTPLYGGGTVGGGCFSSLFSGIFWLLGILFLILAIPTLISLWPLIVIYILYYLLREYLGCAISLLVLLLAALFLFSIITDYRPFQKRYINPPKTEEENREIKRDYIPITDTIRNTDTTRTDSLLRDTLIMHYRIWQDMDGTNYEGRFWVKQKDFQNAHQFKTNLIVTGINEYDSYSKMAYSLKEFDKYKLNGIYFLFDSIKQANMLDTVQLAKAIVSFVQDIPYVLILPDDCDPALYKDYFINRYLRRQMGTCLGFQKFGINTPVEFMGNLKADCDTRTLFLYTVLAHYGYDVALLSSDFYNHSILGINLPFTGVSYNYNKQHYILWETTNKNARPGEISPEMDDLSKWRISLKSK